jgi:hypothetical protein
MSGDLDSILNDSEPTAPEAVEPAPETPTEAVETPPETAEEPKGPVRDDKGRFAPKGEADGVSPTPENEPPLDHAAILGERRRRQEAEARLKELEARIASFQQPQPPVAQQPQAQTPQFDEELYWQNPQAFLGNFANRIRQSILQEVRSSAPTLIQEQLLDRSEALARARYEDYNDAQAAFRNAAMVNPQLRDRLLTQADPAEFAYQEGKRLLEIANYGSTNDYIEAEVAKRLAAQQPASAPVIPMSLADAPASGPMGNAPPRPMPLNDILGKR